METQTEPRGTARRINALGQPASDDGSFVDVAGGFHDGLGVRAGENLVENIFWALEHHCRPLGIALADTDVEGFDSHLSKHGLLLRSVHVIAILLKGVAELEIQHSRFNHSSRASGGSEA